MCSTEKNITDHTIATHHKTRIIWIANRPFETYGSVNDLAERMGHRSTFRNVWVTDRSFRYLCVTGRPFQMRGSQVYLTKLYVWVAGRPFEMYGSPVEFAKCMGLRSTFRNVWITGRPFEMYGSPVGLSKGMGRRSTFHNVWVTGRPFETYWSPGGLLEM